MSVPETNDDACDLPRVRRVDRVLAAGFLDDLIGMPLPELRSHRAEVDQEEVDLSYTRRLVQGRADLIRAEITRRTGDDPYPVAALHAALTVTLTSKASDRDPMNARFSLTEPSRVGMHRRRAEALTADVAISDVEHATGEELADRLTVLVAEEVTLSAQRRQVQHVMNVLSAELTRRYQADEAHIRDVPLPRM